MFMTLKEGMTKNPSIEQLCFLLCERFYSINTILFIVKIIIFPDRKDYETQHSALVIPTKEFQATVYYIAREAGLSIIDAHTHTHHGKANFSCIDMSHGRKNAEYIYKNIPNSNSIMIVFGNDIQGQTALMYDPFYGDFLEVKRIEILGRG